jgi:hypothetical protein
MTTIDLSPGTMSVLSTLGDILQNNRAPVDRFLQQIDQREVINPFQNPIDLGIGDPLPDEFLATNGIYRIVVDHVRRDPASTGLSVIKTLYNWAVAYLTQDQALRMIFLSGGLDDRLGESHIAGSE